MQRRNGYLILGIILVVFTVIAFAAPFAKSAVFWLSFLFGLLAIAFQIPLWGKALSGETLKSKYLSFPVLYIGVTYLIVQLILSILMMAVPRIPFWITLILYVIVFAAACLFAISGSVAKATIERTEDKVQTKTAFLKELKAEVESILIQEQDPETKKELSALVEDIRFSDPMSSDALSSIEGQISEKVASLAEGYNNKINSISEIRELVKQRNIRCKALK